MRVSSLPFANADKGNLRENQFESLLNPALTVWCIGREEPSVGGWLFLRRARLFSEELGFSHLRSSHSSGSSYGLLRNGRVGTYGFPHLAVPLSSLILLWGLGNFLEGTVSL